MPSDPTVGGEQRLIIYPTYGSLTGAIDLSVRSMSTFNPEFGMKPVTTVKDFDSTLRVTAIAEVSTTRQLKITAEAFEEGEITPAVREAIFTGKPVFGFAAYINANDVYYGKGTGRMVHKPNDVENFQEYSLEISSFGNFLTGSAALAAIAALT